MITSSSWRRSIGQPRSSKSTWHVGRDRGRGGQRVDVLRAGVDDRRGTRRRRAKLRSAWIPPAVAQAPIVTSIRDCSRIWRIRSTSVGGGDRALDQRHVVRARAGRRWTPRGSARSGPPPASGEQLVLAVEQGQLAAVAGGELPHGEGRACAITAPGRSAAARPRRSRRPGPSRQTSSGPSWQCPHSPMPHFMLRSSDTRMSLGRDAPCAAAPARRTASSAPGRTGRRVVRLGSSASRASGSVTKPTGPSQPGGGLVDGELHLEVRRGRPARRARRGTGTRPACGRPRSAAPGRSRRARPARRAATGRSGASPTPPATITQVAPGRGRQIPAGAERPADPDQRRPARLVQRPADRADVADRLRQRAVAGRRVTADRDRRPRRPRHAYSMVNWPGRNGGSGCADRLQPQRDRVARSRRSGWPPGRARAASASAAVTVTASALVIAGSRTGRAAGPGWPAAAAAAPRTRPARARSPSAGSCSASARSCAASSSIAVDRARSRSRAELPAVAAVPARTSPARHRGRASAPPTWPRPGTVGRARPGRRGSASSRSAGCPRRNSRAAPRSVTGTCRVRPPSSGCAGRQPREARAKRGQVWRRRSSRSSGAASPAPARRGGLGR